MIYYISLCIPEHVIIERVSISIIPPVAKFGCKICNIKLHFANSGTYRGYLHVFYIAQIKKYNCISPGSFARNTDTDKERKSIGFYINTPNPVAIFIIKGICCVDYQVSIQIDFISPSWFHPCHLFYGTLTTPYYDTGFCHPDTVFEVLYAPC